MKWLLIFVWVANGGTGITTERFETQAECIAVGNILSEWSHVPPVSGQTMRWWACREDGGS